MPIATSSLHPHLPIPLGELSVWQRSVRDHPLLNAGKDEPLPAEADVVIVGSGMCGAVVAHSLLTAENRPGKIVVLEAREICSGASGRNAGHCRPDAARGFNAFAALHGDEQGKHILSSESVVLDRVDAFVKKHSVECEWTPRDTYDVCLTQEFDAYETDALNNLRAAGGTPDIAYLGKDDAQRATRVKDALGAFKWPAATLNPAKLTLGIHALNKEKGGYEMYAWAPVHSVTQADDSGAWTVSTPRGSIKATKVVFATNAYSQAIVPELKGLIIPTKAQAIKLSAAPKGPDAFAHLEPSYSLRYQPKHFYSVASRPDGSIILGTSRGWPNMPPEVHRSINNTVDDSRPNDHTTRNGVEAFARLFPEGGWSSDGLDEGKAPGVEYSWSGIIGMTPDAAPFIGGVPGKEGQYVAAGYNGHGMARIFVCAPALAQFMLEGTWDPEMPAAFRVTEERLARLRKKVEVEDLARVGGDFSKLGV